jgi:serine/threonine protein kinase
MNAADYQVNDRAGSSGPATFYLPGTSVSPNKSHHPAACTGDTAYYAGKIISHYKFVEKIGQGGMGYVYKAFDMNLQRPVAIKILPAYLCANEDLKFQFVSEARLLSSIEHPYICTIHNIFEDADGALYMVMTCYQGTSLGHYIHSESISLNKKIAVIKQVACGLGHAHEKGIVHHDIKPDNVIITNDDIVKIIDFGVARLLGGRRTNGISGGTIAYMSPEQAGRTDVDHRTDIWSLGVIFYELLSGVLPFHRNYDQAILYAIIKEKPPVLHNIPGDLAAIVYKCLEKDPDHRYQSMREMLTDLEILLARKRRFRKGLYHSTPAGF